MALLYVNYCQNWGGKTKIWLKEKVALSLQSFRSE